MTVHPAFVPLILGAALVSGCATMPKAANPPLAQYQPEQQLHRLSAHECRIPEVPAIVAGRTQVDAAALAAMPDLIGPGDRLKLSISGDADVLSGSYVVGANGQLVLKGLAPFDVAGQRLATVEQLVRQALLDHGFIQDIAGNVTLAQAEAAGVRVSVEGAVFEPGLVRAGERASEMRSATIDHPASGDFNTGRTLSTALRAAAGLRPDAAARSIYLVRGEMYAVVDVTPAFTGGVPADPQLAAGDRIIVPSTSCFNPDYVRPSSVTAPGIRIYLSNLARPAAPGTSDSGVPYGTRLLQGLVLANCVGGSAMNAGRQAVLISRNPITGRPVVITRSVEGLVRGADRDSLNPFFMPGDAVACYDSRAMALVDVVGVIGSMLSPAMLVGLK